MAIITGDIPEDKPKREQFTITLTAMPGDPRPVIIRLRGVLKLIRRAFFFRCIAISDASGQAVEE